MTIGTRVGLAVAIVLLDLVAVFVPVMAFVVAYVVLARPAWARTFVENVYERRGA